MDMSPGRYTWHIDRNELAVSCTGCEVTVSGGQFDDGAVEDLLADIEEHDAEFHAVDAFVTVGEAGKILGVSPPTIRRWLGEGKISYRRPPGSGSHRRLNLSDVLAYKKSITHAATGTPPMGTLAARQREMDPGNG